MLHSQRLRQQRNRSAGGFAAAAVLAAGLLGSCNLPRDEPIVRYPEKACSDLGMGLDELDKCLSSREAYVPLYSVTELPPQEGRPRDAGAADAGEAPARADLAPGCLENMSRIGPFCIDQYEAYVVEEKDGSEAVHPFNEPLKGGPYSARTAPDVFPQAHISGEQAEAACRNSGKRLCTYEEWESACMGSHGYRYPYGDQPDPSKCNTGKTWGPGVLFGRGPFDLNDSRLNLLPGSLARTGQFEGCVSDHRVYDMVGNLHEWVSTVVTQDMVGSGKTNIPGLYIKAGNGMFLGGFYSLDPACRYRIIAHPFSHFDYSTGFRCCMDAGK